MWQCGCLGRSVRVKTGATRRSSAQGGNEQEKGGGGYLELGDHLLHQVPHRIRHSAKFAAYPVGWDPWPSRLRWVCVGGYCRLGALEMSAGGWVPREVPGSGQGQQKTGFGDAGSKGVLSQTKPLELGVGPARYRGQRCARDV